MTWLNRCEVENIATRGLLDPETEPNLHRGAQVLLKLMEWVDNNSDGWPYWQAPQRAAAKLSAMLDKARESARRGTLQDVQESELKAALTPIKSFLTRRGVDHAAILGDKPAREAIPHDGGAVRKHKVTVHLETLGSSEADEERLIAELKSRIEGIIGREFEEGGADLMGYDAAPARNVRVTTERQTRP